jgi:hypothetical protein
VMLHRGVGWRCNITDGGGRLGMAMHTLCSWADSSKRG